MKYVTRSDQTFELIRRNSEVWHVRARTRPGVTIVIPKHKWWRYKLTSRKEIR